MYSQQELDARLLDAVNCLRGPVDPADFKAYVFPLLFLKRISDTWKWEYERLLEEFDGDDGLARQPDNFRFVMPDGCRWDDLVKIPENVGAGLQKILDRIQEANPDTLAGIFGTVQWANKDQLPEHALVNIIGVFTKMRLDPDHVPHDLLGNAYEYLLKNFADESGKKAGEFFTPRPVVRLLAKILDPQPGESICDPTCGSGGMLVEVVNEVRARGGDTRTLRLYGQEVSPTTAAIARMNLFLHDIETFKVVREDTLRNPRLRDPDGQLTRFDAVIANPPFSLKRWGREAWSDDPFGRSQYGVPPDSYGDMAFVEHMLATMRRGTGRIAVVMPHGVLFRRGAEQAIREELVRSGLLEAVIGLPSNLFYSTTIPACVLVCRADRAGKNLPIRFVDGARAFGKGRNQNVLRDEDIDAILNAYHDGEAPGIEVADVEPSDLEAAGWSLNIGLHVRLGDATVVDFDEAYGALLASREALATAEAALDALLEEVGLSV